MVALGVATVLILTRTSAKVMGIGQQEWKPWEDRHIWRPDVQWYGSRVGRNSRVTLLGALRARDRATTLRQLRSKPDHLHPSSSKLFACQVLVRTKGIFLLEKQIVIKLYCHLHMFYVK